MGFNFARLKKSEIIWMSNHTCRHNHSYLEHPACYDTDHGRDQKIGFLDLECSNLSADFGIILSYCIADQHSDEILHTVISKKDLATCLDERVVRNCIRDLRTFDKVITYYGCVTPGHRVLKADLTWVPVETLEPGDQLLAFDESAEQQGHRRQLRQATVLHNIPIEKDIYEIKLEDGTILEATEDHPWLVRRNNAGNGRGKYTDISSYWQFRPTNKLQHFNLKVPSLERIMPVWDTNKSHDAGYVGAFIDGEGCVSQIKKKDRDNEFRLSITASQNEGAILSNYLTKLGNLGFKAGVSQYDPSNKKCRSVQILGGKHETLRFLGEIRPVKIQNMNVDKVGTVQIYGDKIPIKSIRKVGKGIVSGLETSKGTYIVEGFGSHNTGFDLPFLRTRAVALNLDFPGYGELVHNDVYYIIRNKFRLSRNRLDNACQTLFGATEKTRITAEHWIKALQGNPNSLAYILDHNKKDVTELKKLYNRVIGFRQGANPSI